MPLRPRKEIVSTPQTVQHYTARADEYAHHLGSLEATHPADRELIGRWASGVDGDILDVGCGPGHWTAFLHQQGASVRGIDPVERFIEIAQSAHPQVDYRVGSVMELADGAANGILAWYSLIHLDPTEMEPALRRCRSALVPGGSLLIGFFDGPAVEAFAHAVTTAHFWPVHELAVLLETVGFSVLETVQRHDEGSRPHAAIIAALP